LTLAGLVLGAVAAAVVTRMVANSLYGVTAADPAAWTAAAVVLLVVTGLANLVPARRAMRVDPVTALRTE
jgi:putative ABC transport system permease protein